MNLQEARSSFAADRPRLEALGFSWQHEGLVPKAYIPEGWKNNFNMAMDAQPALITDPNSGIPMWLTTLMDPQVYEILFAPVKAAEVLGEVRKGTWLDETAMFPTVEHTGEVSSYGDYANNGRAGANTNWPQRQAYLYQIIEQYGEREMERAGLAKINWVAELDKAAATIMARFQNRSYLYGVAGLLNYGLLNDPNIGASLTPATKSNGGATWFTAGGAPNATANEVYNDILNMYEQLVSQTQGLVDKSTKLVLALSPQSEVALDFANTFNVHVTDLLSKSFPGLRIVSIPEYAARSNANPNGVVGGNFIQLWAESIEGQQTGYCAYNERMRAHKIIPDLSSYKQKKTGGTWGTVIRMPIAVVSMIGI